MLRMQYLPPYQALLFLLLHYEKSQFIHSIFAKNRISSFFEARYQWNINQAPYRVRKLKTKSFDFGSLDSKWFHPASLVIRS